MKIHLAAFIHAAEKFTPLVTSLLPIPQATKDKINSAAIDAAKIEGATHDQMVAHAIAAVGDVDPALAPVVASGIDTALKVTALVHDAHGHVIAAPAA
jgi:hypothetical protein